MQGKHSSSCSGDAAPTCTALALQHTKLVQQHSFGETPHILSVVCTVTGLGPDDVAEVLRLAVQQAAPGWRLAGEAVRSTAVI
jgi:hypothetical protein